eukprot:4743200-Alexandrium_andersonii.AAC.1
MVGAQTRRWDAGVSNLKCARAARERPCRRCVSSVQNHAAQCTCERLSCCARCKFAGATTPAAWVPV